MGGLPFWIGKKNIFEGKSVKRSILTPFGASKDQKTHKTRLTRPFTAVITDFLRFCAVLLNIFTGFRFG
jgi:hypothetical protein